VSAIPAASLSADDVGARVSVRRRLVDGVGDVTGDLISLDADQLAVRDRDGSLVTVARRDVVAARVVGPSPLAARDLEAVSGRSWPPLDDEWLGQWWLRAAGGFTARANSAFVLGDAGVALDEALEFAVDWYARRDLPLRLRVVDGSSVDQELARRGWGAEWHTSMQTATVSLIRRHLEETMPRRGSESPLLTAEPPSSWLQRFRGGTLPASAIDVLTGGGEVTFATIESGPGAATAIGRACVEVPWIGFTAIEVDPGARRRGHARAVMSALLDWGAERGALRAWLEVLTDNEPALQLYASLGFTEHHRYLYRVAV
jgi:N-acetylglutamate synthase